VAVITTGQGAQARAITVNSFTSVSLTPRLVLWCLDDRSDRYGTFATAEAWGVSILGAGQDPISNHYAKQGNAIALAEHLDHADGVPVIADALAWLRCRTFETKKLGDHLLIVGEVTAFGQHRDADGLTYFRGRYGLAPMPAA
jgi:flavin reductase (DIM6/NTAB) family NADH-FMN oxidoreductase RutF